jgi:RNA polymerase sigma factor (sigma-70 family)
MEKSPMQRLLEEANAGNRQALAKLLEEHRSLVLSVAGRYADRREDREDLCQETLKAAYMSFERLQDKMAFTKWIMNITANHGKNWLARERPKQRETASLDSEEYLDGGSHQQIKPDSCPEEKLLADDTIVYLVNVLTQNCSEVEYNVIVRRWRGEEYSQIAAALSIEEESTARSHFHRGVRKLWASLLAEHRDFLGGEAVIQGALTKAEKSEDHTKHLTDEEKQAFAANAKSKNAFASACMKLRVFLPLSVYLLLFFWSVLHGQR